ncbi:hypothetical protein ACFU3J_00565 [Streptomyces sp. NPDC057411]|uniref:hypothetical protein n=1 Tax=unclassified Streptomyces TaxID=2593676 RepID=UPI003639F180
MNLSTIPRVLVSALALAGAAVGFAAQTAQPAQAAPASAEATATVQADEPEPVEIGEDGKPDHTED